MVPNPGGGCPENPKLSAEQLTFRVPNYGCGDPENPKHLLLTLSIGCLKTLGAGATTVGETVCQCLRSGFPDTEAEGPHLSLVCFAM